MNVDLGIWSKLTKIVVGLVVLAVLLLIGMCYLPVIKENVRMRRQIMLLQDQVQTEQNHIKELQVQIDTMNRDSMTVERLIREKLEYARPGDTVIHFEAQTAKGQQ